MRWGAGSRRPQFHLSQPKWKSVQLVKIISKSESNQSGNQHQSATAEQAEIELETFAAKWDQAHPTISKSWRRNWALIIPFFAYPADIRKVIYTTNTIESLNMSLRKVTKTRGSFPNDEAIFKLLYLAMKNITKKWTQPIRDWKAAMGRFTILFEDRMPKP